MLQFLALAVLAGCVKAQKQDPYGDAKGKDRSSFRLSKSGELVDVTGYAANAIRSSDVNVVRQADVSVEGENNRYSNRREYSLKMCGLEDIRANNTLLGQKLRVYSELDIREVELTIQNDSCVYWEVSLPYKYFADAVNLEINFIFKTVTGGQKAYIHKTVLFNPWDSRRGSNPEVFDFTRFGISDNLKRLPWARGIDEIDLALRGEFQPTKKKLEIGSVTIVPVQKNKQSLIETSLIDTKLIGGAVAGELDSRYSSEALRLKLNNGQPVQSLDMHLNMRLSNLKVRLLDTAGVNKDEELTSGSFKITAQLIATDQANKGHHIISNRMVIAENQKWNATTMGVNAVLPISLVIRPQWGNLNLLVRVEPEIEGIAPFEGLYHLGRFNEIGGGKSPIFDLSEYSISRETESGYDFNYEAYLKAAVNHEQWLRGNPEEIVDTIAYETNADGSFKLDKNGNKIPIYETNADGSFKLDEKGNKIPVKVYTTMEKGFRRFLFSQLDVLFSRVMPGDTATDRTIQYTVETCLTDNLTGARPGAGLKFEIETEDRGVKYITKRMTNDLGCLTWVGMISHKFYHRENLVRKISRVTYLGEDNTKPSFDLEYYINPWDEKFTFGRDARRLTPEYLKQIAETQEQAPPTRILMTHFSYDATGFRYVIDRYMNMTVKKTVLMTIKPIILKYNSIVWGRSGLNDLRDGIYLMKVAMQKDYIDPMANKGAVITNDPIPKKLMGGSVQPMTQAEAESLEKKQFLVVKETLVRVLGGQIVTPIEFEINDLRTLRIRSQMLIQIETIDEMLLRAALLANSKLDGLVKEAKSEATIEIMAIKKTLADLQKEMEELKKNQDYAIMEQYLRVLARDKELKARMESLLSSLDKDAALKLLTQIDELRGTGETAVSVDRNIKFQVLNDAIKSLKNKITAATAKQEKDVVQRVTTEKINECQILSDKLKEQGKLDEANLYDPKKANEEGNLCKSVIPKEELFYYLTSHGKVGTDEWFKALLTQDEYDLYKSNLLRDDFTKPYPPDFDFNLLSNQGDERYDDDGKKRAVEIDEEISGLPRRTFIGPVTFVLNGNGSAMRPTDVLDENSCNGTCETLGEVESQIINNSQAAKDEVRKFGLPVNSAYENSPYFGSIEHFYKKQVNDLQVLNRGLKYQYHQEMKAFSQEGNFLDQFLLNYVSFGKQKNIKRLDFKCYANWKMKMEESYRKWRNREDLSFPVEAIPSSCFVNSERAMHLNAFMKNVNPSEPAFMDGSIDFTKQPVQVEEMKEFAKNGLASLSLPYERKIAVLHKMCLVLRRQLIPHTKEFEKEVNERANVNPILNYITKTNFFLEYRNRVKKIEADCHRLVHAYDWDLRPIVKNSKDVRVVNTAMAARVGQLPFVVERRVRVLETSNKYLYKDGKTLNYSVGTSFSTGHAMNVNRGYKLDPLEVLEKATGNFGAKSTGFVSGLLGSISGMFNFQWGVGESLGVSDGTSVGENTTLAAQISTLDIELSKWEKCTVVRFDESFIYDGINRHYGKGNFIQPQKDIQGLGYFMCSGDEDTEDDLNPGQPLRVRERYFYLTQIFNEGDMQDSGALANHPWMLQLRGMRDFGRFEKVLKKPTKDVNWLSALEYMGRDLFSALQLGTDQRYKDHSSMEVVNRDDVAKALDLMSDSFQRVLPTFPGMYTYSDTPYDTVVGWPTTNK